MNAPTDRIQVELPSGSLLEEWDGRCLELVDHLLHQHSSGKILYIDQPNEQWKYHAAIVLDGLVYDAWNPDVRLPPQEFSSSRLMPLTHRRTKGLD